MFYQSGLNEFTIFELGPQGLFFLFEVCMESSKSNESDRSKTADELIIQSLARLDSVAMGVSIGLLFGFVLFAATIALVLKGGEDIGPNLSLLSQYFIGYEVTIAGSIVGFIYGSITGFILGWLSASVRNLIVTVYINMFKLKGKMSAVNDFIDNP